VYGAEPPTIDVTVALPLQLEHVAGVIVVFTVSADVVGQLIHVVVRKYKPAIQRLKQSPPVFTLKFEVVAPVATVVFTWWKFHQFQERGTAVPFAVHEVGLN
jgi:uncharacterized membrane protein YhfC